jgi:CRP-like cAMP-binding protein
MPIHLRVARSERQVDDALWLRHQVYVVDDGKFGGVPLPGERIVDRYDAFPGAHNIVVYDSDEPVATMRITIENEVGIPASEHFDFSAFRARAVAEWTAAGNLGTPRFASAGMLAIRPPWRSRRDVLRAMFKVAAGVSIHEGVTHVTIVVNHETVGMYRRLGFTPLADRFWDPAVQNHIVPLAATSRGLHEWAFGDLPSTALDTFKDSFERQFLRSGETVFLEGDQGQHAYIINSGEIRISRHSPDGDELTLAHLSRGELFGELALMDPAPRSATATAETSCELISLDRHSFLEQLQDDPARVRELFAVLCQRIRSLDDLATRLAFANPDERLEFALRKIRCRGVEDTANLGVLIARGGPESLARIAAVPHEAAVTFLENLKARGLVDYTAQQIRFIG